MGWDAYPVKNGATLKCPVGMHAGVYGEVLARFVPNIYWQPEEGLECMDLAQVRDVLKDMNGTRTAEEAFNHVRRFLKWCSDHEAGVWFSF